MGNGVTSLIVVVLAASCVWLLVLWRNSRKLNENIMLIAQQHSLIRNDTEARRLCRAIHLINPKLAAGVDYVIGHDSPGQEAAITDWWADMPRPSAEQIQSALTELAKVHHEEEYAAMRKAEYPSVGEQLDAMYESRQGNNTRLAEVDEKIRRVKEKYPKMDECP